MKNSRLLVVLSLFIASPAVAASVVMVQFGSFETQEEANTRLRDVKAANTAVIGSLPTSVREVKLPPDNLTVYRTQAGPLNSRAEAQALCGKLASNGSECYVVETAVSQTTPATSMANASSASAPASAAATSTANSGGSVRIPEISRNAALPANTPMVTDTAANSTSPEMQTAMDRAVVAQNSSNLSAVQNPETATPQTRSFWSRMNPFSSTPQPTQKTVAAAPKLPEAAPVESVNANNLPETNMAMAPLGAMPTLAPSSSSTPKPVSSSTPITLVPPTTSTTMASMERPRLLPPPAPLTAQDKRTLETPVVRPEPEVLSTPITAPPAAAPGMVNVEEAKRVPVTETAVEYEAPTAPAVLPTVGSTAKAGGVSLLPSSTTGIKTLWAQMGQFNDSEAALNFWENYRQTHPDFPTVRVRIASSLQMQAQGNDRVWLRVGPFGREGFIHALCNGLSQDQRFEKKQCGVITDIGISVRPGGSSTGYLQGSRYKR